MKVSNPLTIIAIFSGIAEVFATIALVQLPPVVQGIFVYFVMAFPAGIVLLFFLVLWFKNTVLYAPSDYEDETLYLEVNKIKLKREINEEIEQVLTKINKRGAELTRNEIEKTKASIEKSVDRAVILSPELKKVLELHSKNIAIHQIAKELNVSSRTIYKHMRFLRNKDLITDS